MSRSSLFVLMVMLIVANTGNGWSAEPYDAGVSERLGQNLPHDLTFYDEKGSEVKLSALIDKPVVLTLVYYRCSHICPQMLLGLSEVFAKLEMVLGTDYRAITISLDENDSPEDANTQKINYMKAINRPFPADSWKFLVGEKESIENLSDSVGISYMKDMHGFIHPEVLVFVSPHGQITKYLYVRKISYGVGYPVNFSKTDIAEALTDASRGLVKKGVSTAPLLCFPHEPVQQKKFFRILAILGTVTLLLIASFFIYLSRSNRKFRDMKDRLYGK